MLIIQAGCTFVICKLIERNERGSTRRGHWIKHIAAAVSSVSVERGFAPGSDKGKTRAKPAIWENPDDFADKLAAFRTEAAALAVAAKTGDQAAATAQFKKTGGTCKACHDEYKARNYLY